MKRTSQRIKAVVIFTFMAQMIIGCDSWLKTTTAYSSTPGYAAPTPNIIESPNPANADAQATMDYGQNQLLDLSRKATEVSLDRSQKANAAAQATQDYNQRQQIELDYQATVVSLNITQAAATQDFISHQTQMVLDATLDSQRRADAATQSAYLVNITQTAQAQVFLDTQNMQTAQAASTMTVQAQVVLNAQGTQAAQAISTMTAYPLTATPYAVTKAALLMQQYDREQQAFEGRVVAPMIKVLAILDLLMFILGIVLVYRLFMTTSYWHHRPRIAPFNDNLRPLIMINEDRIPDRHSLPYRIIPYELPAAKVPRLPERNPLQVEIIDATEPYIAHWIAEVEYQLANEKGL